MNGIEIDNKREVAVVIYKDENLIWCLQQELVNAVVDAFKHNEFAAEQIGIVTHFNSANHAGLRLAYGRCMGLHINYQAELPASDELQAIVDGCKRDAISAELVAVEKRKNALQKQLEQLQ